ncbi:hypothetical protein NL676_039280 [Syzygium grande]|nr:hypothetical protein NL676_039280 [Syzygium grande]
MVSPPLHRFQNLMDFLEGHTPQAQLQGSDELRHGVIPDVVADGGSEIVFRATAHCDSRYEKYRNLQRTNCSVHRQGKLYRIEKIPKGKTQENEVFAS